MPKRYSDTTADIVIVVTPKRYCPARLATKMKVYMPGARRSVVAISGARVCHVVPVAITATEKRASAIDEGLKTCALLPSLFQRRNSLEAKAAATIRN